MLSEKYENLLKMKEPPEEMSIMELGVYSSESLKLVLVPRNSYLA